MYDEPTEPGLYWCMAPESENRAQFNSLVMVTGRHPRLFSTVLVPHGPPIPVAEICEWGPRIEEAIPTAAAPTAAWPPPWLAEGGDPRSDPGADLPDYSPEGQMDAVVTPEAVNRLIDACRAASQAMRDEWLYQTGQICRPEREYPARGTVHHSLLDAQEALADALKKLVG